MAPTTWSKLLLLLSILVKNHKSDGFQVLTPSSFSSHKKQRHTQSSSITTTHASISNNNNGPLSLDTNDDEDHEQVMKHRVSEITNKNEKQETPTTFDLVENTKFLEEALNASYLDLMELNESVSSANEHDVFRGDHEAV